MQPIENAGYFILRRYTSDLTTAPMRAEYRANWERLSLMSKMLRWLLATLIFIALLVWVEYEIGWGAVLSNWRQVSIASLCGLTLLTLFSYGLRGLRIFTIFGRGQQGHRFRDYLRISLLHNALNNFLPMRLGEASFPLLMKHHYQQSILSSSAALLWIRLMDLHWLLVMLAGILCIHNLLAGGALLAGLLVAPLLFTRLLRLVKSRLPASKQEKVAQLTASLPAIQPIKVQLYLLTMLIWSVKLAALTLIMLAFIDLPAHQALFAVISADLSSVLPIHGLAGSGTYEAAMIAATLPFGIDRDLILMAAVNVHIYLLLVTLFSIVPALLIRHQSSSPERNQP